MSRCRRWPAFACWRSLPTARRRIVLPAEELQALEATAPCSVAWYRAKTAQLRGHWSAARQEWQWLADRFDRSTPAQREGLREFRHQVLAEQAFILAFAARDPAALHGDAPACLRWLDLAQRHAEDDADRALASGETRLAAAVRAVAGTSAGGRCFQPLPD